MGGPLKISLTCLLLLIITKAKCQEIVKASDKVNVTALENNRYLVAMDENNHEFDDGSQPHTLLFKVVGASMQPTISFAGSTFAHAMEPNTTDDAYYFYATQSFDYETQEITYRFNVIFDSFFPLVTLSINNIDDERPSLTSPQCNFDENTIYTAGDSPCNCTVSDPDGWLDLMTFEIVDNRGGEGSIFALEYREVPNPDRVYTWPVYVTVREELNYQNITFYLFDIRAQDGAGHSTTPNELVRAIIYVTDLPDTPPEWTNYFTFQQFEEQEEQTFHVTAIDGDYGLNYEINYSKLWEDDPEEDYISIDNNGTIKVKKIDRDKNDISMYNFEIMAYEVPDAPIWNNTLNISFYIIDIDNNPPLVRWLVNQAAENVSFDDVTNKSTSLEFLENYAGNLNLTIYIRDIDTGENAQFNVELEDLEDSVVEYTDAFLIVPSAGYRHGEFQISVRNATYLDYEVPEWDHIQFNVLTRGMLDPNKEDRMLVDIHLIDYNDEIPIFAETEYEIYINETAKKGEFIIQIMATDRDAEDKILTHSLISSTYTNRVLAIESDTGRIYVNDDNAFDYDTVNPIFVQVRATDKVGHIATVPLTINLWDVNNKAPTIIVGDPINVDENQNSTTRLNASITASDMDTTAWLTAEINWERSYAMKNSRRLNMSDENVYQQVRFLDVNSYRVNDTDDTNRDIIIELVVNDNNPDGTTPDFELFDSLYINLVVTDWNTDPEFLFNQNTSVIILISINDINDNTPYFPEADLPESERQNRTVLETATEGMSVGSIIAIDLDVDDTVTYHCEALDPNFDWILVNPSTGALTVKADNVIDADTHKTFYFNYSCTASDDGNTHTSDPLEVRIYIIDVNNKVPVITMDDEVWVDEKSLPDTWVSDIGTHDDDRDIPFHTVECMFAERNSTCAGSFIIDNNVLKVRYGYDDINRDEGLATYTCSMTCQDNPDRLQNDQSQHTLQRPFTIHLRDINDHTPEVVTTNLATNENLGVDEHIGIILATDIDEGDNAEIVFNVTKIVKLDTQETVTGLFDVVTDEDYRVNLTFKQANLIALEDLRGKYGSYDVTIGVADKGDPPNSDFYGVIVDVAKFNFEAPRFIFPTADNQNFTLLSAQELNTALVFFRRNDDSEYLQNFYATDNSESDQCGKWDVQFSFDQTSPEGGDTIFTLAKNDTCTSQLQITNRFNSDAVLGVTYRLQITARVADGEPQDGEAPYTAQRNIIINFLDNNQKPVFNQTNWEFEFREEDASQTHALDIQASYEVDDDSLSIFYYLVSSNDTIRGIFNVDRLTGLISLNDKLNYEADEFFEFQIVASNDSTPSSNNPNSYLNVKCNVIDINNNVPQWRRAVFSGAVMSGYIRNTPVLTVEATDADKIDQGHLTYYINGSITKNGNGLTNVPEDAFLMTPTTGEIRLNFQVDGTMTGYFQFDVTVWDQMDQFGNGPHWNTTQATILIITKDNTVDFRFYNTMEEVQTEEVDMLRVISNVLNYDAYKQNINKDKQGDVELNDQTIASLYFINSGIIEAVEANTILRLVSSIETFSQLVGQLRNETGLILTSFPSTATSQENLEEILRAWLVGVSVVLGALCIILLVTFILKTRELNNRITNLTKPKFGSQESGLNRLGISAPTTNKHAIEGSNPIFNINGDEIKRDLRDFDTTSIRSGDSDLIGIEDSPEFDYEHGLREGTTHL